MAQANIFISCLGTGDYKDCRYRPHEEEAEALAGFSPSETRFIQAARLEALNRRKIAFDKVLILLTGKSRKANWLDGGYKDKEGEVICGEDGRPLPGLGSVLDGMNVKAEAVQIPDGANESEFWEIFSIVSKSIPENASLYVDLTHGFRTMPILLLMALEFVTKIKNAKIEELTYGAFISSEAENHGATWNLESFLVIRNWADAVSSFVDYGDTRALAKVANMPIRQLAKVLQHDTPEGLRALHKALDNFGDVISKCYSPGVAESASKLKRYVQMIIDVDISHGQLQPLKELLGQVMDKLADFPSDLSSPKAQLRAQWAAAKWCFDYGRAMQAMTFLREGMVSILDAVVDCKSLGVDADGLFGELTASQTPDKSLSPDAQQRIEKLNSSPPFPPELWQAFCKQLSGLAELRNKLNHGYRGKPDKAPISSDDLRKKAFAAFNNGVPGFMDIFRQMLDSLEAVRS